MWFWLGLQIMNARYKQNLKLSTLNRDATGFCSAEVLHVMNRKMYF